MLKRPEVALIASLVALSFAPRVHAERGTVQRTCRAHYEMVVQNNDRTETYGTVALPRFLGVGKADGWRKYDRARAIARDAAHLCMWEHYRNDNVPDICRGWWTPADGATRNYVINDTELAFEFAACSYAWMPAGMPGGAWGCSYSMTAETTGEDPCEHSSWLGGRYVICRGPLPEQLCNQEVVLRSNSGDYLSRERDGSIGVSAHAGYDEFWTVECAGARIVQLRSSGGDYLHRPDTSQGVTTWHTGNGNRWRLISNNGDRVMLRSWQGDYLHRSASAVTTWPTGPGNLWIMELR